MSERPHRTRILCLRVTDEEAQILTRRAADCGLSRSAFLRKTAFGAVPRMRPHRLEQQAIRQLARVGSNLNQLARHANASRRVELSRRLAEVLQQVEAAIRKLA